jgi:general stress protein 26
MQPIVEATPTIPTDPAQAERTKKAVRRKSFAVLSTVSAAGFPHAAGVLYASVDTTLYVHTMRSSRKARNVADTGRAAVVIPVRRLPIGPPFTVQFQATASVLAMDDAEIVAHLDKGRLGKITGYGALEEPDGCFIRITPAARVHTYGIGVSAIAVARDPLHVGDRITELGRPDSPTPGHVDDGAPHRPSLLVVVERGACVGHGDDPSYMRTHRALVD